MSGSRPITDMEQWIRTLPRVIRFCLAGGLSTAINLGAMAVFVEGLRMDTFFLKSIANLAAMAIGTVVAFFLHRAWTWEDAKKRRGLALLHQFLIFIGSVSIAVGSRICLFAIVDHFFTINYILNVAMGIAVVAIVDYFLYARFVFGQQEK